MRWRKYGIAAVLLLGATGALLAGRPSVRTRDQGTRSGTPASRPQPADAETTLQSDVKAKYLRVALRLPQKPANPGDRVTLIADITPGASMHVYAPEQSGYIPVALKLVASPDYTGPAAKFPASTNFFYEPLKETVKVYDKPFRIQQDVTIARRPAVLRRAQTGEALTVSGALSYQACDDAVCYRPDSVAVAWTIALARPK
jgi:Thiol:disulfide interchange protein DsbD, N-terminal